MEALSLLALMKAGGSKIYTFSNSLDNSIELLVMAGVTAIAGGASDYLGTSTTFSDEDAAKIVEICEGYSKGKKASCYILEHYFEPNAVYCYNSADASKDYSIVASNPLQAITGSGNVYSVAVELNYSYANSTWSKLIRVYLKLAGTQGE